MNKTKTRIWHLCSNRWNSAITEYALASCQALEGLGFQNIFVCLKNSPGHKRAQQMNLSVMGISDFRFLGAWDLLRSKVDAGHADVERILCYGGPEDVLAQLLFPTIKRCRFVGSPTKRRRRNKSERLVTPNDYLSHKVGGKTVLLGLTKERFTSPNPNLKEPILTIFGRLDPVKGHREFMECFADLVHFWAEEIPQPKLQIVGRPANLSIADLREVSRDLKLRESTDVEFIEGDIDDVPHFLSKSTLGVVPSLGSEWIARVSQEFLAVGVPVFSSGVGGLEDVLFLGAGWSYRHMTQMETVKLLRSAILSSFGEKKTDRELRVRRAQAGFSLERMQTELLAVLGL